MLFRYRVLSVVFSSLLQFGEQFAVSSIPGRKIVSHEPSLKLLVGVAARRFVLEPARGVEGHHPLEGRLEVETGGGSPRLRTAPPVMG
jgi:hypothetical protein